MSKIAIDENYEYPWESLIGKVSIDENLYPKIDFEKPLVLVRDENDELQWESTLNALNIIKKDASQWSPEDKQVVADAYREAWAYKDCKSLDKMTSAMCDKNYGEITSSIALLGRNYERSCEIVPNADKYQNVLDALDSNNDAELYYTVNRIGYMPSQTLSIEADNPNNLNACADYQFQETDEGMKVSLTTSAYGVDRTENYAITSMDINKQISEAGIHHLKEIGYEDSEIEAFKRCALTDTDAVFLNKLAEGDYESAYRVDPSQLSDLTKMQLSTYQTIYATRERKSEYPADAQKQANILFNQDNAASHDEVPDNAYQEYFTIISDGMEQQSVVYANKMQSLFDSRIPFTTEDNAFFEYGTEVNRANVLWDTFDALYKQKDSSLFEESFGHVLRDKDINLQVSDLRKSGDGDYSYDVIIADPQTDMKSGEWNCIFEVECQRITGMDISKYMIEEENISNQLEIGKIKENLITDVPLAVFDRIYPVNGLKSGMQLVTGLIGKTVKSEDVKDVAESVTDEIVEWEEGNSKKITGEMKGLEDESEKWEQGPVDYIEKGVGIVTAVAEELISAQEKIKELEAEIAYNNQYLKYCQNGELNLMHIYIKNEDTGLSESQNIKVGTNNITPEVLHNMMRWSEEGIIVCLRDLGVKDPEDVKEQISEALTDKIQDITSGLDDAKITDREGKKRFITEEDVRDGLEIMLNGGDFSTMEPKVREKLEELIGKSVEDKGEVKLENGMYSWLQERHVAEASAQDISRELSAQKQGEAVTVQDNTNELIVEDEPIFKAFSTEEKNTSKVMNRNYER